MHPYIKLLFFILIFFIIIDKINSQYPPVLEMEKSGSCPPPLPRTICRDSCKRDFQCPGNYKCCKTSCGGTVCSRAVSGRSDTELVKPGRCPNPAESKWVCTSTCFSDGDCPTKAKCCRNRCGAMRCSSPIMT